LLINNLPDVSWVSSWSPFDEQWMREALALAAEAFLDEESPIGAIVVRDGERIATGRNEREKRKDPLAHAELLAIRRAAEALGDWRLERCTLYVTLEPCPMCAGAIVQARIPRLVYGAADPKAGACGSLFRLTEDTRLNHRVQTIGGVLGNECGELLTRFFAVQRAKGKK
jgi:tRNA(adenine34) deaminase